MQSYRKQFIFLTSLFFLWGFITVLVDSLIPRLREVFTLSYFQAGMVQFAFFTAYFLLSIPAGYFLGKIGYKKGIILGLGTMALGCMLFYPAASLREFWVFMLGYFVLAGGMTILQVAANPYVAALGPGKGASSRLNLSQAFNSLGTSLAPIFGSILILSDHIKSPEEITKLPELAKEEYFIREASAVQTPFLVLAITIALMAVLFSFIKLPSLVKVNLGMNGYKKLIRNKWVLYGAIGILLYVGAEVTIGSYLINYFLDLGLANQIRDSRLMNLVATKILGTELSFKDNKAVVGAFVTFYWSGAMVGRFFGAYLTKMFNPGKVLTIFAIGACSLIVISIGTAGFISMWSVLGIGFFNSIMFPTIFTLSIDGLEDLRPHASGVLCSMIVGGALIPPAFGITTDYFGFKSAFLLVLLCYCYIIFFGRLMNKKNIKETKS